MRSSRPLMKTLECFPEDSSLKDTTGNRQPFGLCTADHNPLSLAVQTIFHLLCRPTIQIFSHHFGYKHAMRDHVQRSCESHNIQHPLLFFVH